MTLYENIYSLALERGYTIGGLSKAAHISTAILGDLKRGKTKDLSRTTAAKLADVLNVSVDDLYAGNAQPCPICGLYYNVENEADIEEHTAFHKRCKAAIAKYGFFWATKLREERKNTARVIVNSEAEDNDIRISAQIVILKALFSRSLEHNGFSLSHPHFEDFVVDMLANESFVATVPKCILNDLKEQYRYRSKISNGMSYYTAENQKKPDAEASGVKNNTVKLIGRDGSYKERTLTDEQLNAVLAVINQMPDADDL